MTDKKHWLILGSTALISTSLLFGCTSQTAKDQPAESTAAAPSTSQSEVATADDRPGAMEGELMVVTAKVKAIDKKQRIVTLKFPDGKITKIKCGPEVRNFPQIRIGDDVTAKFLESTELFVTGEEKPTTERSTDVKRAPLGSKPGFAAVDSIEVKASVEAINYQTRDVILKGPEGKILKIKAGPEVKRLNEVHKGDTVVARLTRAVSIQVTTPDK